jgi:hypothetical protein
VTFQSYFSLDKTPNKASTSELFEAAGQQWRVLLFPGGNKRAGRVGVYLQWVPLDEDSTCDATFTLQLMGQQRSGRRFNVAFSSGMRFVHPSRAALTNGLASDFGSHLMAAPLLASGFTGGGAFDDAVEVQVAVTVHAVATGLQPQALGPGAWLARANGLFWAVPSDLRPAGIHVGQVVIPVIAPGAPWKAQRVPLAAAAASDGGGNVESSRGGGSGDGSGGFLSSLVDGSGGFLAGKRPRDFAGTRAELFRVGAYPGVEYRVMRVFDPPAAAGAQAATLSEATSSEAFAERAALGREAFEATAGSVLELQPLYPLVKALVRPWPVAVPEAAVPAFFSEAQYNAVTVAGALAVAASALAAAAIASQAFSLFYIPSRSMEPTLLPGDVLLVEKVFRLPLSLSLASFCFWGHGLRRLSLGARRALVRPRPRRRQQCRSSAGVASAVAR